MNTSSLCYALIGIKKFYGGEKPMSIDLSIKELHDFHSKEADVLLQIIASVNAKFYFTI